MQKRCAVALSDELFVLRAVVEEAAEHVVPWREEAVALLYLSRVRAVDDCAATD